MRKPPRVRGAGGLGREIAARLGFQAERERWIADIKRRFAARGLRADVLGDGTPECPFLIMADPFLPGDPDRPPCDPSHQPDQPADHGGLYSCVYPVAPSSRRPPARSTRPECPTG